MLLSIVISWYGMISQQPHWCLLQQWLRLLVAITMRMRCLWLTIPVTDSTAIDTPFGDIREPLVRPVQPKAATAFSLYEVHRLALAHTRVEDRVG